jgi:hypothetical protein
MSNSAPGANITSASDAPWYTIVTISTVGYGDRHPVTNHGRVVGTHHRHRAVSSVRSPAISPICSWRHQRRAGRRATVARRRRSEDRSTAGPTGLTAAATDEINLLLQAAAREQATPSPPILRPGAGSH